MAQNRLLTKQEAMHLLEQCLEILYHRDCAGHNEVSLIESGRSERQSDGIASFGSTFSVCLFMCVCVCVCIFEFFSHILDLFFLSWQFEIGVVTADGCEIYLPKRVMGKWEIAQLISGYE
jgi:multidrug efflux pump subunit AcrB